MFPCYRGTVARSSQSVLQFGGEFRATSTIKALANKIAYRAWPSHNGRRVATKRVRQVKKSLCTRRTTYLFVAVTLCPLFASISLEEIDNCDVRTLGGLSNFTRGGQEI